VGVERRIAVLGPMLELGDHGEALHAGLASAVLEARWMCWCWLARRCGRSKTALDGRAPVTRAEDSDEAAEAVARLLAPGDAVLVKASNSVGLARVVKLLKEGVACSTS
jgi:UDP-N-acetylmuramyl pentapeptide synthase